MYNVYNSPAGMVTLVSGPMAGTGKLVCKTTSTGVGFGFCSAMPPPRSGKLVLADVQLWSGVTTWSPSNLDPLEESGMLGIAEKYSICEPSGFRTTTRFPVSSVAPPNVRSISCGATY